jgi:hypothetical protein
VSKGTEAGVAADVAPVVGQVMSALDTLQSLGRADLVSAVLNGFGLAAGPAGKAMRTIDMGIDAKEHLAASGDDELRGGAYKDRLLESGRRSANVIDQREETGAESDRLMEQFSALRDDMIVNGGYGGEEADSALSTMKLDWWSLTTGPTEVVKKRQMKLRRTLREIEAAKEAGKNYWDDK